MLRSLTYEAYCNAFLFSPDGKWIFSAHRDGKIKQWDVRTGAVAATLQAPANSGSTDGGGTPAALSIGANGEMLAAGSDTGVMTLWNLEKPDRPRTFGFGKVPEGTGSRIRAIRLTGDQSRLIAVTEDVVKTFDVRTGKEAVAFVLPNKYPLGPTKEQSVFDKDSIISDDGLVVRFTNADCEIEELRFLSLKDTGNLATIDKPENCKRPDDDYSFGEASIFAATSQPSLVIARSGVSGFKQWDIQSRSVGRTITWTNETRAKLIGLDRDFKLAVSRKADSVSIREFADGTKIRELTSALYPAETAAVSRDGRFVLLSHDASSAGQGQKDVTLWQIDALGPRNIKLATNSDAAVVDFAPDAKLAVVANSKSEIILFSTETGNEQRRFAVRGAKDGLTRVRLSPDGKLVAAVASDDKDAAFAVLIDTADGSVKHRFAGRDERGGMMASTGSDDETDMVTAFAFSADASRIAVGRWNGTAELWDTQKLKRIKSLPASRKDADQIWSLAFTTDGRRLIAGSRDSGVFVWDLATGRPPRSYLYEGLAGHVHVAAVALSHDGSTVAGGLAQHAVSSGDVGPEHGIKVWNAATGKLRFTLRGHDGGIGALAFSSDDRWIVSASFDGTIRYWNSDTGRWFGSLATARDGGWVFLTESGFFAGTSDRENFFCVVRGLKSAPPSRFRDQLARPGLVESLLKSDPDRAYAKAAKQSDLEKIWQSNPPP